MNSKNILIIYAHPDDESFGNAGTIVKYTKETQANIYLAVATRGEAGKMGEPPLTTREQLGSFRAGELKEASAVLGLKDIFFLDFMDGTLDRINDREADELTNKIADVILQLRPDIVITFPEDGISRHKDHIAIHKYCMDAIALIANQYTIPKVYFTVVPESIYQSRNITAGVPDTHITTSINIEEYRNYKYEALTKHRTQIFSVNKVYPGLLDSKNLSLIYPFEYYQLIKLHGNDVDVTTYREKDLYDHL